MARAFCTSKRHFLSFTLTAETISLTTIFDVCTAVSCQYPPFQQLATVKDRVSPAGESWAHSMIGTRICCYNPSPKHKPVRPHLGKIQLLMSPQQRVNSRAFMSENASPCVQFPDRVLHHYCRGVPPDHPHACGADLVGGAQVRFLGFRTI